MENVPQKDDQKATSNNSSLIVIPQNAPDGLRIWSQWYFDHAKCNPLTVTHALH